ncbi:hypothetical protein RFN29_01400 [Mesorhizobium sp. VK22B]|uniref:Uncharacterized protein n=1 Tax=Mesorhizobium captivum TaxID=3072319 RepID=A0ABU4YTE3_9HYPH|nr:hypothetical protein [Mesorhizobium sp. VK22B]MDX8490225.1 hypothetical protein [Mesorhizobium sp. VK22B]
MAEDCRGGFMSIDLQSIAAASEILSAIKNHLESDDVDHSLGDELCNALRIIYFVPDSVLSFLRDVSEGLPVSDDRIRAVLSSFNDRQWNVEEALDKIDFARLGKDLRLNLRTASRLQAIRVGKISLRRDIQNEINYYGQRGIKPDRKRVAELTAAIEKLNNLIEEVEMLINKRPNR